MTKNQPNLNQKQLKKLDMERKSKGKIKKKKKRKKKKRKENLTVDGLVVGGGGGGLAGAAHDGTMVGLSESNRRWRMHGGWVLAGDGKCTVEWRAGEWSTVASSRWG
jgi:hypothetical protein